MYQRLTCHSRFAMLQSPLDFRPKRSINVCSSYICPAIRCSATKKSKESSICCVNYRSPDSFRQLILLSHKHGAFGMRNFSTVRDFLDGKPLNRGAKYRYSRSYDQFSDDDFRGAIEIPDTQASSSIANIDEWKWKLTTLMKNKDELEIVSKEKKDRRDYEQIQALARRMGLHCQQYERVVVVSKIQLPNYRPDLDDRRPQREVIIPPRLRKQAEVLLEKHLYLKNMSGNKFGKIDKVDMKGNPSIDQDVFDIDKSVQSTPTSVLMRRGLLIRDKQRAWQETTEGKKTMEFRKSLPAYTAREALLDAVSKNQVVVVSGETGCGKTTQLPQYVLESEIEAGRGAICNIVCTQPRRISAISVAERVAGERGEELGESVGYKVRLEGMKGRNTRLLFCTTGILLRRLLVDRELKGVSHVVIDEIHERGMNEDFLLIILKGLLPRRPDLKLILMSATLNADLFSSYFNGAPTMHIPGFTHPVKSYFLEDILDNIGYQLTSSNQLDDYGQDRLWKTQKQVLKKTKGQLASDVEDVVAAGDFGKYSQRTRYSLANWNPESIGFNLIEAVLCHICMKERPGAVLVFMTGWDDINALKDQLQAHPYLGDKDKVLVLSCHGSMATSEQRLIFDKPPSDVRKIVLATNMAETSITINDVVFVVDLGKAKETSYDALNNTPCLLPSWISKASARQRKGRAGRVQPGDCYHLYPRCVHDNFAEYQLPELLRTPLQSLCLQIKSLQLGGIAEFLSRALQPPEPLSVENAVKYLKTIGALDENENLTKLGQYLSLLPVEPKLGKMLIMSTIFNCLDPILTIAAGLSSRDPFLLPHDKKDLAAAAKSKFSNNGYSDHLALVQVYEEWRQADSEGNASDFCWDNFLSPQVLKAMSSLRQQFSSLLKDSGLVKGEADEYNKLNYDQNFVRAVICAGLFPSLVSAVNKPKSVTTKTREDGNVVLFTNSVNGREQKLPCPWLVFFEKVKVNAVVIRDSTGISDSILLLFGGPITRGTLPGHLKMLDGYLDFFMEPELAGIYLKLKEELDELIYKKLKNPTTDIYEEGRYLMQAVQHLLMADQYEGNFVFGRQPSLTMTSLVDIQREKGNPKGVLQTLMSRARYGQPIYKVKPLPNALFRAMVECKGMQFVGKPFRTRKEAEKDAAMEAIAWFTGKPRDSSPTTEKFVIPQETYCRKNNISSHYRILQNIY